MCLGAELASEVGRVHCFTFPSHVQKVPVSLIVFSGMTASIFSTLSCGVRSPSIGKSASMVVISLYLRYESATSC
jgi:hypothetical protein